MADLQRQRLRQCMLVRMPSYWRVLEVFAANPDFEGTSTADIQRAKDLLAKKHVVLPASQSPATIHDNIAEWAQTGLGSRELEEKCPSKEEQAMYYGQRVDALEAQNLRLAEDMDFRDSAEALAHQKSSLEERGLVEEPFRAPPPTNIEGYQLEVAKSTQGRQAEELLKHTPMRAMKQLLSNNFVEEIL